MSTIRRIPTSQIDGNDADTNNENEIRPYGEIGLYEGNNDKLELLISDGQRTHFKSKVLAKGTFYGGDADSADGNNYDTIKLIPDVNLVQNIGTDQYVIIDPTAPDHIHIRAGGPIDDSNAELIVGGENSYVKISNGENPPVQIASNTNIWNFSTSGVLELASGGIKFSDDSVLSSASGLGAGNPFDQNLNTTDFPSFSGVSLSNGTTLAQGTFDNNTGGNNGISLNCYVGYELNWQGGHLKCTQDGGATSANITLDSALQFSDNVVVCSTADNLALKYAAAKTLTPGGNALSSTNRATLIIMPGNYSLSEELVIDAEFVDILGLGSMKLDRGCVTAVTLLNNNINVTANDVRVKGISLGSQPFVIQPDLYSAIFEDCIGGDNGFGYGLISSTFINCIGGHNTFGNAVSTLNGSFINCIGGNSSFGGGGGTASGTFKNCVGLTNSFGGNGGISSGDFKDCVGGDGSFGSNGGESSGTFTNCSGGNYSFGGYSISSGTFRNCVGGEYSFGGFNGTANGTFINCIGDVNSFGGAGGTLSGTLLQCRLTSGTFQTLSGSGKIRLCIDGNYDVINADAP